MNLITANIQLVNKLNEIKQYNLEDYIEIMDLSNYQENCIRELLSNTDRFLLGNGKIENYDQTSCFIMEGNITKEEIIAMQIIDDITECFTEFDNAVGSVEGLKELLQIPLTLEQNVTEDNEFEY